MKPYMLSFMVHADSLLLGIVLGAFGVIGLILIIKYF